MCVKEPIEEWHTPRNLYNNVVWVAAGGDLPLIPGLLQHYVEILKHGLGMVLTVSTGDKFSDKQFVGDFLWSLYSSWRAVRRPMFLVVEEADTYAPQMWTAQDRPSLSRMALISERGRKLGLNIVVVSQRPADIRKSIISQCNIIFLGGFKTAQDLTAVRELSRLLHLQISTEEVARLHPGEFFAVVGGEVVKIRAHLRKTPHGGSTPELHPAQVSLDPAVADIREELLREESDELARLRR